MGKQVVIVGASIGGLVSAAVLARFCERIVIVEKDDPPYRDTVRRYAPQGAHISILLQAGLNMLNDILPGFKQKLIDAGAAQINAGDGQQVYEYGAWRPARHLEMTYLGQSRLLLEALLYEEILRLPNVDIRKGVAKELIFSESGEAVIGLNLGGDQLNSDLIIDGSGASGSFCVSMQKNAIAKFETDKTPINIFYSTVHFKKPDAYLGGKENILIVPEAGVSNLGGSLLDIENDCWCVSLHGRDGESVPKSYDQWLNCIKSLPDPRIWQRIKNAHAISEVKHFKKAQAVWRRFDCAEKLPIGYLPIGDTINSLNPIFGQGMTVCIGHAYALMQVVEKHGLVVSEEFMRAYNTGACQWTKKAWTKTTSFDKNFLSETCKDKKRIRLVRDLTSAQHKKIEQSEEFHLRLVREAQMLS